MSCKDNVEWAKSSSTQALVSDHTSRIFFILISLILAFAIVKSYLLKVISLIMAIIIIITGFIIKNQEWTQYQRNLMVRVIHGEPSLDKKFKKYYAFDLVNKYLELSQLAPIPELTLWPESALPINYSKAKNYLLEKAIELKNKHNSHIVLGTYVKVDNQSYNIAKIASSNEDFYKKTHLIPFGEYQPKWFNYLSKILNLPIYQIDNNSLNAGTNEQKNLVIHDIRLGSSICYETLFSNEMRHLWQDTNLLFSISDLNWFRNTWALNQYFQITRVRAMENEKYMLISTSYGVTAVVSHKGQILTRISSSSPKPYLDAIVELRKGNTPYSLYGLVFIQLIFFLNFLVVALYLLKKLLKKL
ncbi:MAG: apolipoprotein N-acyltransferase [Thiofilum sp.]|uniref:apolipoprotein N-acyltransferase n=1 Tax=Thiofilum sp. TaxID=2212733 RepID=UPI0025FD21E8|nr:apolipoprotein N-acyltransferase [Thiofilum sp.]